MRKLLTRPNSNRLSFKIENFNTNYITNIYFYFCSFSTSYGKWGDQSSELNVIQLPVSEEFDSLTPYGMRYAYCSTLWNIIRYRCLC